MFPHERSLVARLSGQPFALLGVNSDEDRDATRARIAQEGLTWRSFWNGGGTQGGIAADWNVQGWPTLYVIDRDGIIRYKSLGGREPEIDAALGELLGVELGHEEPAEAK